MNHKTWNFGGTLFSDTPSSIHFRRNEVSEDISTDKVGSMIHIQEWVMKLFGYPTLTPDQFFQKKEVTTLW